MHTFRSCWVITSGRCSWKAASHETEHLQSMEWLMWAFALTGTATLGGSMHIGTLPNGEP
jgi:hypothetical protein